MEWTSVTTAVTSFNRYMVECEFHHCLSLVYAHRGFNRYMVECEFSM